MFKGLVTLVTGGASGLGRATVQRFANKGSKVVFCDLATSNGDSVAKEIGENATFIPANVTSEEEVQNLLKEIADKHGRLDVLVNCAGIAKATKIYDFNTKKSMSLEEIAEIMTNNVTGTFNTTRLAAGLIGKNTPDANNLRGVIINTAGIEGLKGTVGQTGVSAASGAIIGMTQPIAKDLAPGRIRVVTVAVGWLKTPLLDYIPVEMQDTVQRDCMVAPNAFGDPDQFAHLAQTIVVNPHINATTIEFSAGLNMAL